MNALEAFLFVFNYSKILSLRKSSTEVESIKPVKAMLLKLRLG